MTTTEQLEKILDDAFEIGNSPHPDDYVTLRPGMLTALSALIERERKEAYKARVATVTTIARDDLLQDAFDTWVDVNGQRFGIMFDRGELRGEA
jgi:hypothetical protein